MPYRIRFMKNDVDEVGSTPWNGSFESAKEHALAHLEINRARGATRVEVRDDDTGDLMFAHPRTVHA